MNEILSFWTPWQRPSSGLATVHWAVLLAVASLVGYLLQRTTGIPKVVGYALIGTIAGVLGLSAGEWPLHGPILFIVELGVSVVLFECGGRIALRWFRHNPMVLVQSVLESALTYGCVYTVLRWLQQPVHIASSLALIAMASSPVLLRRVGDDTRASGPVTDRAMVLATLSTLYALTLGSAKAGIFARPRTSLLDDITPVLVVLGVSIAMAAVLALLMRLALRIMSPSSENTSILMLALIAAVSAVASHMGGSAALAALLGGIVLKQLHPRPWAWPRQLGTAASLLSMLMFVLVSCVAAGTPLHLGASVPMLVVLALVVVRLASKTAGVALGNLGSGSSWRQSVWVAGAMAPMSAVALLITAQFAQAAPEAGQQIARIALPAILLLELAGAVLATWALYRAGEGTGWRGSRREAVHAAASRSPDALAPTPTPAATPQGDHHAA